MYVNQTVPEMKEVVESLAVKYGGFVEKGGVSAPTDCVAKDKVKAVFLCYTV